MCSQNVQLSSGLRQLFSGILEAEEEAKQANKLYAAVADNNLSLVQKQLSEDTSQVDELNHFGQTPLYVAARNGNADIVSELLRHGAHVRKGTEICDRTSEDNEWKNPLHVAKSRVIVDMLLDAGADINDTTYRGDTALHTSVRCQEFEVVECLIRMGLCVNVVNKEGLTPLHEVCDDSDTSLIILRLLLDNGADINAQTYSGRTPLHYACDMSKPVTTVRELLSNGAKLDIADYKGDCPIHTCVTTFYDEELIELFTLLVKSVEIGILKDAKGRTMLHISAESCGKDVVETIVTKSSCVNEPDNVGKTPLHYAALNKDNRGVLSFLLANGATINAVDSWGQTALHEATGVENVDALKQLLADDSCDVSVTDVTGVTALHVACLNNSVISIEQLLSNSADVNCSDNNKSSPLHFAAWHGDTDTVLADLLLNQCVDIFQKDGLGHTCLDIAIFRRNCTIYSALTEQTHESLESELISELSSVGNKLMKSEEVIELMNNEDGVRRSIADAEQYVSAILTLPGIGRGTDEDEAREIQAAIEDMIQTLAERIGSIDSRFKCVVLHAGSTSEGTKTRLPDEFDFMFALEEFSKHCEPTFHDEDTHQAAKLNVPIQQKREYHTLNELVADDTPIETDVSVSDYVAMRIKDNTESDAFHKFAGSNFMPTFKVNCGFSELLTKAIFDKTFPKRPSLAPTEISIDPALRVRWRGARYKHVDIDIDIVPAILLPHWHEKTRKDSILMTPDILRIPSVAVPKMAATQEEHLWRSSMALVETCIFRKLRPEIRNSYIACKALVTSHIIPAISFGAYEEKKVIYRHMHGSMSSEDEIELFEHVENLLPSYILKMSFLYAVEEKAHRDGLESVYSTQAAASLMKVDETLPNEQKDENSPSGKDIVKEEDETVQSIYYGPATEMNVAVQCADFNMELVRQVFQRCEEGVANRFVPSIFNEKQNVLGNALMSGDVEKVEIFIKLIRKLIE